MNEQRIAKIAERVARRVMAVNKFTRNDIVWMNKGGQLVKTTVLDHHFNGGKGYTYTVDGYDKPVSESELSLRRPTASEKFDGMSPQEYAAQWGSTKGQGAAHFYNYGSEKQVKDQRFYYTFMNGEGGIKDTLKMITNSLVAKDGNFTHKDYEEMWRFAQFISNESRHAV